MEPALRSCAWAARGSSPAAGCCSCGCQCWSCHPALHYMPAGVFSGEEQLWHHEGRKHLKPKCFAQTLRIQHCLRCCFWWILLLFGPFIPPRTQVDRIWFEGSVQWYQRETKLCCQGAISFSSSGLCSSATGLFPGLAFLQARYCCGTAVASNENTWLPAQLAENHLLISYMAALLLAQKQPDLVA